MKLCEVISDVIKHDLKKNRGRGVKALAKASAGRGNASAKDARLIPGNTITDIGTPETDVQFSIDA